MRFLFILALLLMPAVAMAHDGVHIENAYALETPENATVGAVFLDLATPEATAANALLKVVTPRADKAEIHTVSMDDMGIAKMRPLDRLAVPAKMVTSLKQGGDHIMLIGLHGPLVAGETFPMTLTFEHGDPIDVTVTVKSMSDTSMPSENPHAHH